MPISKQIRNLCKNTFDLRYHTTRCNQRKKMTPFSAPHYDVTVYLNFFYDVIKRKIVKKWPYIPNLRKIVGAVFECHNLARFSPPSSRGPPVAKSNMYAHTQDNNRVETFYLNLISFDSRRKFLIYLGQRLKGTRPALRMRNFLLESNETRFRPKKTTYDIFEN